MFTFEKISKDNIDIHLMYFDSFELKAEEHVFFAEEKQKYDNFKSESRKREFLATRILKNHIFGKVQISYTRIGAPYIDSEGFISVSHATGVVAIAFSKFFKLGLDLEPVREKIHRVKHKFLSEDEESSLDTDSTLEMIKVWSGKEALYKLSGRKGLIFAKEMFLNKISEEKWEGTIYNPTEILVTQLRIFEKNGIVISINTCAVESIG